MKWLTKAAPTWVVLVLLAAVTGVSVAWAVSKVTEQKYATMAGEVVTVTEELSANPLGITVAPVNIGAKGTELAPITMIADPGDTANNTVTKGHYVYKWDVTVAEAINNANYTITLWKDGTVENTIYITQGETAVVGDKVTITWDIGTSLETAVWAVEINLAT